MYGVLKGPIRFPAVVGKVVEVRWWWVGADCTQIRVVNRFLINRSNVNRSYQLLRGIDRESGIS